MSLPLALLIGWASTISAQESPIPPVPASGTVSAEQLDAALAAIEARDDLGEDTRSQIIAELRRAQAEILAQAAAVADGQAFATAVESAPPQIARLQEALDNTVRPPPTLTTLGVGEDLPLSELEQVLAREAAEAASLDASLNQLESALSAQRERPAAIRARMEEVQKRLDELAAELSAPAPGGGTALLSEAQRLAAAMTREALRAELTKLEQEQLSYDLRLELLRVQRDTAAADASAAAQGVALLQGLVNETRQTAAQLAQTQAAEAELAAADKHPALRTLAEGNLELTRELPAVATQIEEATATLREVEQETQQVRQAITRARQRLEIGGISQATGRLFVDERRNLPRYSQYRLGVRERRRALSEIGLAQVRIEEQQRDLTPLDGAVEQVVAAVRDDLNATDDLASIRDEATELLRSRRDLLQQAAGTYRTYVRLLGDLDSAQQRLLDTASDYRGFLDQNLIWIPNSEVVGPATVTDLGAAVTWATSPANWLKAGEALPAALRTVPGRMLAAVALLLGLLALQPALKRRYRRVSERVGRLSSDHIGLTLGALAVSAIEVLPVPLAFALCGWALQQLPAPTDFSQSLATAFLSTGPFLYNVLLIRILSSPAGVLRTHFGWRKENLAMVRLQLNKVIIIGVPLVFITVLALTTGEQVYRDSLGRVAFVLLMLLFAAVAWPLGHPQGAVGSSYYARRPSSWLSRLKWLWFSLDLGIPLGLAVLALLGYLYTAAILVEKVVDSVWLVLGLLLLGLIIRRWLALERRKLAIEQARERREALKAEQEAMQDQAAGAEPEVEPAPARSTPLDLDAVDQQTQKLLGAGMLVTGILGAWAIWSDVFPALTILNEVSLWMQTVVGEDGGQVLKPVSLADVLLAALVGLATFVLSRNLPGLMEIAVLRHFELEAGGRYTINTLLRYTVVTIGVVLIFSIIGWNWSRIQWLVAALSVGLGFGLQEIVANFVSGLIILFERPIRIGDTVTVGDLSGTVSKVRIRATTITDWDRKEIIVPNKSFITEQVVNWTLSDPITRVVVPVGISYGSDIKLAGQVMRDTLQSLPLVLDEPGPSVYFVGFGDSSLNFNLYVFSRQLSDRLPLMHAVHSAVLENLRQHDIEIPFPQRDLHVRSVSDDAKGWDGGPPEPADS
ncbi:MAG: mechanosensitive ion channel domain-containing protein [Pseudomonadota bacterium]